jgi:peptide-methionine (S)-S-oxide reductase
MNITYVRIARVTGIVLALGLVAAGFTNTKQALASVPDPKADAAPSVDKQQVAVFAGGCFWGIQAVFEHMNGVIDATSGYAGGVAATAHYDMVSAGNTGHAESVRVRFNPNKVSYGQLLKVYFSVAHDPTQLNRQGPDSGTQYRSEIFYTSTDQQRVANAYIAQLQTARAFERPIVTQVERLKAFYPAENYHQDYARLHPYDPYIAYNDLPKVARLKQMYPQWYHD